MCYEIRWRCFICRGKVFNFQTTFITLHLWCKVWHSWLLTVNMKTLWLSPNKHLSQNCDFNNWHLHTLPLSLFYFNKTCINFVQGVENAKSVCRKIACYTPASKSIKTSTGAFPYTTCGDKKVNDTWHVICTLVHIPVPKILRKVSYPYQQQSLWLPRILLIGWFWGILKEEDSMLQFLDLNLRTTWFWHN